MIIGLGGIARSYAAAIVELDNVEIAAIVGLTPTTGLVHGAMRTGAKEYATLCRVAAGPRRRGGGHHSGHHPIAA